MRHFTRWICSGLAVLLLACSLPVKAWAEEMPQYFQTDYPYVRYGSGSIATSGCSVTCLAMVASCLTGHTYLPDELADFFSDYNSINHMDKLEYMSDMLQLPWEKAENFPVALKALQEGKLVIALMNGNSLFTTGQHFIVWAGINEEGKILVNDSNAANYSLWNLKNAFDTDSERVTSAAATTVPGFMIRLPCRRNPLSMWKNGNLWNAVIPAWN